MTGLVALLAAGLGTRFGGGKLDAPCAGRPLGHWALATAQALGAPVVAVTGPAAPAFLDAVPVARLVNSAPAAGLGGSVALAAEAARGQGADWLLVVLADMPLVRPDTLARLVALAQDHGLAATDHGGGARGVPACFGPAHFAALAAIHGEAGARGLLRRAPAAALVAPDPGELADVDDPAALAAVAAELAGRLAGRRGPR